MDNSKDVRKVEQAQRLLKDSYRAIQGTAAAIELLTWLESERFQNQTSAESEMDNPGKRSLYLQNALTYDRVKAHLEKMFSKDAQDRN